MSENTPTGHLNVLMGREMTERIDETPENLIGRALNIAEFLVLHNAIGSTEDQVSAAKDILETRGLSYLLDVSKEEFQRYAGMVREQVGSQKAFCILCGRSLKNPQALKVGMGVSCRVHVKEGKWTKDVSEENETSIRRAEVAANDILPMDNPVRLGLRRLADKYGITVSSIRVDRTVNKRKKQIQDMVDELVNDGNMPVEADYYPRITEPLVPPPLPEKNEKAKKDPESLEGKLEALKIKEVLELIEPLEDRSELETYLEAEKKGKNRKGVIKTLETKIAECTEKAEDPEDTEDPVSPEEPSEPLEE